jgi:DMSO/TMAO reductase YedYZ molybdopterin-dependent catalytic subunit
MPRPNLAHHRPAIARLQRRGLLRTVSLGSLAMLTGCNLEDDDAVDHALLAISRWNDSVQAALFSPTSLAREYSEADITRPFPFNAYYPIDRVKSVDPATWKLELAGEIDNKSPWTLDRLEALEPSTQITRHICIEGWSAIGQWSGPRLSTLLTQAGANLRARYVAIKCADDYSTFLDMPTALHPQTILATKFRNEPLPAIYGAPLKIRVPTKLGFKNPKHVIAIEVQNSEPDGFWEKYGYNRFSGL